MKAMKAVNLFLLLTFPLVTQAAEVVQRSDAFWITDGKQYQQDRVKARMGINNKPRKPQPPRNGIRLKLRMKSK